MRKTFPGHHYPWKLTDLLVVLVAIAGVGWLYDKIGRAIFSLMVKVLAFIPATDLYYFLVGAILQTLMVIGLVCYFSFVKYQCRPEDLGLGNYPWPRALWLGFLGGISLFSLMFVGASLISLVYPEVPAPQPFAEIVMRVKNWRELIIPLLVGSVLAPVSEEMYFRGFVYPYLRSRLGVRMALWLSAMFFSVLHLDVVRFIPLMLGGFGLAWLYERTGSLYPSVVAHGVWNGVMTFIIFWSAH
ncbi:MAG: CPBP family intramembrane metalloprotease [Firmicutes bacterium]|nr:CPBP family intramembrane metalloprotease [Bacillota bacterium]